jgi:predicted metal-dependent hydrolase
MTGFAQKFGAMNEADFEFAKEALRAVQDSGIANVPTELADIASQVAPEYIAKQREELGAKRAGGLGKDFKGIDDSLIGDFEKSTLAEVRAQVDKVKADVRVQINLDAEQLAEGTAKAIVEKLGAYFKSIDVKVQQVKTRIGSTSKSPPTLRGERCASGSTITTSAPTR